CRGGSSHGIPDPDAIGGADEDRPGHRYGEAEREGGCAGFEGKRYGILLSGVKLWGMERSVMA
ncbi:MAG: hypothetical protein AB7E24_14355, partial [Novosphingobium sp.]